MVADCDFPLEKSKFLMTGHAMAVDGGLSAV